MKKRNLLLLLSIIVVFSFTGCGQEREESSTDSLASSSDTVEITAQEPVTDRHFCPG